MDPLKLIGLAALSGAGIAAFAMRKMFRDDVADINAALEAGSNLVELDHGQIEYGREGSGQPVLVLHGAGGGYDQGLFVGRELFGSGHDLIAPSRFGYLRSGLPHDPQPYVQADAVAELLDHLKVPSAVVLGISAGAPSAIELALRHPEHVRALILIVPRAWAPGVEVSAERTDGNRPIFAMVAKGQDFAWWMATKFAARRLLGFLGVPSEVYDAADPLERDRLKWIARNILPLSRRVRGILADGETRIARWPLGNIATPTLVVSAKDDLFNTLLAARWTAEHVPAAELMVLESGGHLLCGQGEEVRVRIAEFVRRRLGARGRAAA
jgi:2-hydroxy-6-oxonona-2,4-dienedioate hydrolase